MVCLMMAVVRAMGLCLFLLVDPKGMPLPPLYIRGAGLQGRFPSRLRVGVLVGYNCISCYTRKVGSYLVDPTHPIRVSMFWASSWVSRGNIPHTRVRRHSASDKGTHHQQRGGASP